MARPVTLQVQALELIQPKPGSETALARVILNPVRQVDVGAGELHGAGVTLILPLEEARVLYPLGAEHELALIPTGDPIDKEARDA